MFNCTTFIYIHLHVYIWNILMCVLQYFDIFICMCNSICAYVYLLYIYIGVWMGEEGEAFVKRFGALWRCWKSAIKSAVHLPFISILWEICCSPCNLLWPVQLWQLLFMSLSLFHSVHFFFTPTCQSHERPLESGFALGFLPCFFRGHCNVLCRALGDAFGCDLVP